MRNNLNNLDNKTWLRFQKSWFIHNPPPRDKRVLAHPAKFPETMAREFIEFFTKEGDIVLDPMAGTGSAVIAAYRAGRIGMGIELSPKYSNIANAWLALEGFPPSVINVDARDIDKIPYLSSRIDYVITSPPYWDILHVQKETYKNRASAGLDVVYSDDNRDLGNIKSYDEFIDELIGIYCGVAKKLKPNGYMTVIVKNVKKEGKIYPLAWDIARYLNGVYLCEDGSFIALKDEKIWCQDNATLAPYGMGNAWVSNIHHTYCLQFRKEKAK